MSAKTEDGRPGAASARPVYARQEQETGFTAILGRLLRASPGAIGAALVDAEGETVDYAGEHIDPFELKVAAATWRIVLGELERGPFAEFAGVPRRFSIYATSRTFVIEALPEGYAFLSVLASDAAEGHATRALDLALRDLYREAGWASPPGMAQWFAAEVRISPAERPIALRAGEHWAPLTVIGRVVVGLLPGEVGWRVALAPTHVEITVVHGRDDQWWVDLDPESLLSPGEGQLD